MFKSHAFYPFPLPKNDSDRIKFLEKKVEVLESEIKEFKDILKEAGVIITPPKNISIPDPRGYSVNKIK